MLTLTTYNSENRESFFEYLKNENSTSEPAYKNMWDDNWYNNLDTLPYLLERLDRFDEPNGAFHIIKRDEKIIGCGGVYVSSFSPYVAIAGVRTWVSREERNNSILRECLLPEHKKWCIDRGIKVIALTFNHYNRNLINVFKRRRLGETTDRVSTRQPHHLFYNGLNEVVFPVTIQYTQQWVIYEKLDNWDFDWSSIRFQD